MNYKSYYNYRALFGYKALLRDVFTYFRNVIIYLISGKNSKNILFYPQFPDRQADIYQTFFWSRYRMTSNPKEKFDYVINWEDSTFKSSDKVLEDLSKDHFAVNLKCDDISKEKVERVFNKVFGYSTFIDPLTYQGKIIEKSDLNSKHSQIKVLLAPINDIKKGFVYQRFLFSRVDQYFVDYRVPFVNGQIPLVFIRYKNPEDVSNSLLKYRMLEPPIIFDRQEIEKITEFCREMNLDYGEMDIIRDMSDNRLYIIDVNTTPHQPKRACGRKNRNLKHKMVRKLLIELLVENEQPAKTDKPKKLVIQ